MVSAYNDPKTTCIFRFLVQDSETNANRELKITEDAITICTLEGLALNTYHWPTIRRWVAEQKNVFILVVREGKEKLVEIRLHCDDAGAIQTAFTKGVKTALAKQKELQKAAKALPTVYEENDNAKAPKKFERTSVAETTVDAKAKVASLSSNNEQHDSKTTRVNRANSSNERELWSGWLRTSGRFSIGFGSRKRWYVLTESGKLHLWSGEPKDQSSTIESTWKVKSIVARSSSKSNKAICVEVIESGTLNTRQLNLEADSSGDVATFTKALKKALNVDRKVQPIVPAPPKSSNMVEKAVEPVAPKKVIESDVGNSLKAVSPMQEKNPLNSLRSRNSLLGNAIMMQGLGAETAVNDNDDNNDSDSDSDDSETEDKSDVENVGHDQEQPVEESKMIMTPTKEDTKIDTDINSLPSVSPYILSSSLSQESSQSKSRNEDHNRLLIEQLMLRTKYLEEQLALQQERKEKEKVGMEIVPVEVDQVFTDELVRWGEMELLNNRVEKLEKGFEDLKLSFNAIVQDLTSNLLSMKDLLTSR